jgi:4-amino-4-deoxy-L-arabinose transferase-like glycosyltransferase
MQIIRDLVQKHWFLLLLLIAANAWKGILYGLHAFPFNADEAVVGLMARHILAGERPLFFYGQAYMGSLDAWLVAGGFWICGQHIWVIRAVQTVLFDGTIGLWYLCILRMTSSLARARFMALLLAIPPVLVTLYTTVSLGGYGEAMFLGSGCYLLTSMPDSKFPWRACVLGALTGFGLWVFPLSLVYSLPAIGIVCFQWMRNPLPPVQRWLNIQALCISVFIGAVPLLLGIQQYGASVFQEMGGGAIAGSLAGSPLQVLWIRFLGLTLFGGTVIAGVRPPWEFRLLALPLLPIALALWLGSGISAVRALRVRDSKSSYRRMLLASCVLFAAVFLFSPFGNDPSGRYFLPLYPICAAALAGMLHQIWCRGRVLGTICVGLMVAYFAAGTLQTALQIPPGITTQFDPVSQIDDRALPDVILFLREHGETRGYTNYWISFPLAFRSQEELIFTARLPYHEDLRYTLRDDRYPPYDQTVTSSSRVAFITARNPLLDVRLTEAFHRKQISFRTEQVGDYIIYYGLSQVVQPEELDLAAVGNY